MLMPMNVFEWQVLRAVLRAGRDAPTGQALRLVPSRRTKDGSFLWWFTTAGLLTFRGDESDPFACRFYLTDAGRRAAEWGEFEVKPALMAKLVEVRNAKPSPATA